MLAGLVVLLVIVYSVLKPLTNGLLKAARPAVLRQAALAAAGVGVANATQAEAPALAYEQQVAAARGMVAQDPKRGAQVVKAWVASDA